MNLLQSLSGAQRVMDKQLTNSLPYYRLTISPSLRYEDGTGVY